MSKHPADTLTLVADIGGTNTRVALADGVRLLPDTVRRYSNDGHDSLETVLCRYIAEEDDVDCRAACVAVAGPVRDGVGTMTNLDWTIDRGTLERAARAERVAILNDLQAQGHALGLVAEADIRQVLRGAGAPPHATRLVVGVGTGFNAAPVVETGTGRVVAASECGHANLPIRTDRDLALARFVEEAHGFPAIEDVLSGRGLSHVYRFLATEAGTPRDRDAAAIMRALADGDDPLATEAVRIFVRTLGVVIGNLCLIHLPFGGVYLVGGVARHIAPHLARFGFEHSFRDKGRFSDFMADFPVSVIEDDYAALTGCASHICEAFG
ncbi:ROK family protein [Celeribacter indicus]|uniref:Glucokinase n=1 Tax=Celeribacter indicus TaxID=1208324 RepID=A0A0B5E387_9RHOB|nr:ROK family protein [Celeribacter indicus]AJE46902.1 glucokinase [Celeribacter indicus]SDW79082.1 glucokinase [Celeribacter indicus]